MVVYESYSLNCKTLALNLNPDAESVIGLTINEPVLLITPTMGRGAIGRHTNYFLKTYNHLVKGVVVSGDSSYKELAWKAADSITKRYPHIELVLKIEKQGTDEDFKKIQKWYHEHFK